MDNPSKMFEEVVMRYYTDQLFHNNVDLVVQIMETEKGSSLSEDELAIVRVASGLTTLLAEQK